MAQDDRTRANQLIDRFSDAGGLNVPALCDELSKQVMTWTLTVFEVFEVLTERGFNQSDHEWVCRELIDKISPANLIQLAQSRHGWILLERIYYIMNCEANAGQATCNYIIRAVVRAKEIEREKHPRKLSEEEMKWYANYNESKDALLAGMKKPFQSEICRQLPIEGDGFVIYTRNDLTNKERTRLGQKTLNDKYGYDQIGTKETIEAMIRIAKEWSKIHSDRRLQYGDVSRPGGINTPDHGEHNTGKAFDMRLLRKDNQLGGFAYTARGIYSPELTKEFILMVVKLYPGTTVYFNDPQLNQKDEQTRNIVDASEDHDDHLHVMFPGGKE